MARTLTAHQQKVTSWSILILPSLDGQDFAYAVLYPDSWTVDEADDKAVDALMAGQQENPEGWAWDDCEDEFTKRGFVLLNWHHGPTWDEDRKVR
jgi:hypothetical protein